MENLEEVNKKINAQNEGSEMLPPNNTSEAIQPHSEEIGSNSTDSAQVSHKCGGAFHLGHHICYMVLMLLMLVSIVVLFILHFTQKPQTLQLPEGETKSGVILTVNNDSIVAHFELVNILNNI